jgi:hypothetical protein
MEIMSQWNNFGDAQFGHELIKKILIRAKYWIIFERAVPS